MDKRGERKFSVGVEIDRLDAVADGRNEPLGRARLGAVLDGRTGPGPLVKTDCVAGFGLHHESEC